MSAGRTLFLDLECTGLNPKFCSILEVAAVVVSDDLDLYDRFDAVAWKAQGALFSEMDEWCTKTHTDSGLVADVLASSKMLHQVDEELAQFIAKHFDGKAELAGNSVHFDLGFISEHMPRTAALLSHRVYDVSGMHRALRRYCGIEVPFFKTDVVHRAMPDVLQSIEQMRLNRAYAQRGLSRKRGLPRKEGAASAE